MSAIVVKQNMVTKWNNGLMTVRYVVEISDGSFVYGEDADMPANEKAQLENVANSQRRRLEGS